MLDPLLTLVAEPTTGTKKLKHEHFLRRCTRVQPCQELRTQGKFQKIQRQKPSGWCTAIPTRRLKLKMCIFLVLKISFLGVL